MTNVQEAEELSNRGSSLNNNEQNIEFGKEESVFCTPEFLNVQKDKEMGHHKSTLNSTLNTQESSLHNSDEKELSLNNKENSSGTLKRNESSFNSNEKELPFNVKGVLMSIYTYTVFHYCLVVQETITTPMVIKLYDWSATQINLLFAGAGAISLVTSLSVRYGSRRIRDQTLLIAGISIGLLGSILQMDIPQIEKVLPVGRFAVGFMLTYIAYSIGRNVVLGIFSNALGPYSQGAWVGVITAAGAIPGALAPFVAWQVMEVVYWRTWLEFGLRSLFLVTALVGSIMTVRFLVPYSEFVGLHTVPGDENVDRNLNTSSNSPPSPNLPLSTPLLDDGG